MLAASLAPADVSPVANASDVSNGRPFAASDATADQSSSVVVFVDAEIAEVDVLLAGADRDATLVLVDSSTDAIECISQTLSRMQNVASVHLVGHGASGQIRLGGSVIDSGTLTRHADQIGAWSNHLSETADIMLYGCETARGRSGLRMIERLAELTGADVAASTDLTGNAEADGDWELELHTGPIESAIVFDTRNRLRYRHALSIEVIAAGSTGEEIMELQIDGSVVATFTGIGGDADAGVFESFVYDGQGIDPNLIRVAFTNDLYEPELGIDRNLRVDAIVIDGERFETESPTVFSTGTWKVEDGIVPGNRESEILHSNGYFQYAGELTVGSTVVVTANGDDGRESFELLIDGEAVADYQAIGTQDRDFIYRADQILEPDQVSVRFTNDVYDPDQGIDYNLNVDRIVLDGTVFETEAAEVFSTGTWLPDDGITPGFRESETLHTNGVFQYAAIREPVAPSIRINAGGEQYTDVAGNIWQADEFFDGGNLYSTTADIFQSDDDALYQTERWSKDLSYDIPVANGAYTVDLHFAEIFFDDFGQRIFDVRIEDQLIEDDLDIYERSRNAFFPGNNNALVVDSGQVFVSDGVLDLDLSASINNAKLSAIEVKPISGPGLVLVPTDSETAVAESGLGDSYIVRLNTAPTDDVIVELSTDDSQIDVDPGVITLTQDNWRTGVTVTLSAVDDSLAEGTQVIPVRHTTTSSDVQYDNRSSELLVRIVDDDVVPIDFEQRTIASVENPTTAAWGPDGRLYIGSTTGLITALTLNENHDVVDRQDIDSLVGLTNNNILGLAFNPFSDSTTPEIYASHSQLFANGGSSFPETQLSPYSGQVSIIGGQAFDQVTPLITGLPVSNHDHGINGLAFDNTGDLYVAVGGNTNAGIINSRLGGIPESPFSAAVLKADISKAEFNGQIEYELIDGFIPPGGLGFDAADSQTWGDQVTVATGIDVSVFASGLRNPYDLVFTTDGLLYATDNGPNNGFGDVSTGAETQIPVTGAPDELNLLSEGDYFGHPNRTRGEDDPIQNVYFGPNDPSSGRYVAPLTTLPSSTNGIDQYRSTVFGGQLLDQLVTQKYNGQVIFIDRADNGLSVESTQSYSGIADGLDLLMGSGGTLYGIDFAQDRITVATPNTFASEPVAYDINLWRAPASGGLPFVIAGENFGDLSETSVTIGGTPAVLTSVSSNRINGILPSFPNEDGQLLDIVVTSSGVSSTLSKAFLPLA